MRRNVMKRRLRNDEVLLGTLLTLEDPAVAEIWGYARADFVVVDAEHSMHDLQTIENMLRAAELANITCLVRVPDANPKYILRVMEGGAQGIIVPQVRTAQEVRQVAEAMKYAPRGGRGLHVGVRAPKYSSIEFFTHLRTSNAETLLVVMIETKEAVECIEEILAIRAVDVAFIGTWDLSSSLGVVGRVGERVVMDAVEKVRAAVLRNGRVRLGMPALSPDEVQDLAAKGYRMILYPPSDAVLLLNGVKEALQEARRHIR